MKKKVIGGLLAAVIMVCGFMGVSQFVPEERTITINNKISGQERELTAAADDKNAAPEFQVAAKGAVLMDADSGRMMYAQDADVELPPASVTKVMTMLLILEGVEQDRISLDDAVAVSENAASMGGSQMYLEPGEKHTVEELLMGIAMVSANDACVAVAEHLYGSVEIFVEKMNARARELGMDHTNFMNTNGLPAEGHYSSAYDIGIMTSELLKHESSHKWLTKKQAVIKIGLPGKEKDFELINSNKLLYQYEGALGVKTGFTQDAMFCLSGAAERNNMRLVAVVLGSESSAVRFNETKKLLDYGFANYEKYIVAEKGKTIKKIKVEKGTPEKVSVIAPEQYSVLIRKGENKEITTKVKTKGKFRAPVKKGRNAGELVVYQKGIEIERFPLIVKEKIRRATLWERVTRKIGSMMPG